jgi:hypothetical protein
MTEEEQRIAFGYTKVFDLEEIMQKLLGAPKAGSFTIDVMLNEFVSMTYDPPPAYFGIPPYSSDRNTALEYFGADLDEPPAAALDICIDAIANRIAAGERFVWGTA